MVESNGMTGAAPPTWEEAIAQLTGPEGGFALEEIEVRGERQLVFKNTPPSLPALFGAASLHGDKPFLVYEDESWSFTDTMRWAGEFGALLVDRYGVEKGDRVAIAMRNYPEWISSFAAITSVGAIAVCLNAWWTTDELDYALEDSGARVLIGDLERIERARPVLSKRAIRAIVIRSGEPPGDGIDRFEDVVVEGAAMPGVQVHPDDDSTILYTSGTTGHPKGAVSTHRGTLSALLAFACRSVADRLVQPPPTEHEHGWPTAFILAVPLFHVTGLIPVMMSCFAAGWKLVMLRKWDPERALELIERERITQFVGVPTMSWDLLESPDFALRDTSSLQNVGAGGAPAPPALVQRIDKCFERGRPGIGYGMTETNAYGPQNSGPDYLRKPRSTGRAVPTMQIKIADADAHEVPRGDLGEIFFRGPNLIRGYWNKPEATAEVFVDGWLRSGDLGRMDEEGFVFVEDRAKDMVLRAGENVYCAEVEAAIYQYPGVRETAVFGIPHQRLGEEVVAAIVPKAGSDLDREGLTSHLREHLAAFKVPSRIELHSEELPRNAAGKILKRALRDAIVDRSA